MAETNATVVRTTYHSALTVTNIRNLIPLILDLEKVQYTSWASLFRNTAKAHDVLDHIDSTVSRPVDINDAMWSRLDAIVLQWIYGTISVDLLHTILDDKASAMTAWTQLQAIFQDNKNTRAVHLENQFSTIRQDSYPNISAYCQQLKTLADQLTSIGNPVSDERLVIQLVSGLSRDYDTVATVIQQISPLPSFPKARSMLVLEETRRNKQNEQSASPSTVLLATAEPPPSTQQSSPPPTHRGGRGGRDNRNRGRNRGGRNNSQRSNFQPHQQRPCAPWQWYGQWGYPPCPYPSMPNHQSPSSGILGPAPRQPAQGPHAMLTPGPMQPTDLPSLFNTLTLQQPDPNWYMDTGASSHLMNQSGFSDGNGHHAVQ